jgi:parvulin-like peptidyl-prolyl isomerase
VNGVPLARSRIVALLLRAHGAGLLEQMVGLELAGQLAAERGLSVRESDIEFEYDLALRRLSDPLAVVTPADFDREPAERVLDSVLAERNISREEFLMTIRRNAYLRKVAVGELFVPEADLRDEYDRVYGERAEVRHIQLGSERDARDVMQRLDAGDDFEMLASRYSANVASAHRGGLLEPFSRNDEAVPDVFRKIAFGLEPGEVSGVIQIGEWRHLIRLERIIPPDGRSLAEVRSELEPQLRGRLAEEKMQKLFVRLMREATIEVNDPNVAEEFNKRRQGRP